MYIFSRSSLSFKWTLLRAFVIFLFLMENLCILYINITTLLPFCFFFVCCAERGVPVGLHYLHCVATSASSSDLGRLSRPRHSPRLLLLLPYLLPPPVLPWIPLEEMMPCIRIYLAVAFLYLATAHVPFSAANNQVSRPFVLHTHCFSSIVCVLRPLCARNVRSVSYVRLYFDCCARATPFSVLWQPSPLSFWLFFFLFFIFISFWFLCLQHGNTTTNI